LSAKTLKEKTVYRYVMWFLFLTISSRKIVQNLAIRNYGYNAIKKTVYGGIFILCTTLLMTAFLVTLILLWTSLKTIKQYQKAQPERNYKTLNFQLIMGILLGVAYF